ncbi:hypothetical protein HCN44_009539 [Aphidius gifuensis]|uniref:Uncharacterized protein n=1 Tax=Aphidius gifuensis TaxID=684658 RepID=A0A834Y3Y7_APHGI|nr:probable serine/threonine-protein kinase kinX [Aphidius gifuensis]KAF7998141.1 hypothetical protein HCN44_009539 [Aphidius gifuensis]
MEDNEDEPIDVQKATPVVDEVVKGEIDEESSKPRQPFSLKPTTHNRCPKELKQKKKIKTKEECCDSKWKNRIETKRKKTGKVIIYEKPCTIKKIRPIPRHCLTKNEWYNLLSRPSKKCPSQPRQIKIIDRPLRPVSARMNQLALPPRNRMLATLEDRGAVLPPELIDKLIQIIETKTCLTPEQAENLIRDKKKLKKKIKNEKNQSKIHCTSDKINKNDYFIQPSTSSVSVTPQFDEKAVNYQYTMANAFVKSILQWESQIPREEFSDISDVIIKRLENVLEYQVIDDGDRVTQQMKFLSDIIASWIAGVLFEVGEAHKEELEKECEERKNAIDDESDDDSDDDDSEVEIIMEPRPEVLAKLRKEKELRNNKIKDEIKDSIKDEVKDEIKDSIKAEVKDEIKDLIKAEVKEEINDEIKDKVDDKDKDKEKEKSQVGDSYNKLNIKEEPKKDDDNDDVGGAGATQSEASSPGQTAPDSQPNENEESKPAEEKTPDEKKGEEANDDAGEKNNIKQDNKSEVSSKKIKFVDESEEIGSDEKTMEESLRISRSDSVEEIPQEPKVYETITIEDGPENDENGVSGRLEPVTPVKLEKLDVSVKEEPGLLKESEIKKEKDQEILDDPLSTKIKSEKKIENDLPVVQGIKQEPDLNELSVSQIKAEKIKEELPESIIQDIKQEPGLMGVSLSQIKSEKIKDESMGSVGPEKIKQELSGMVNQGIKQEPGLEKIPLVQIKSEKVEYSQSALIKPEQIKQELSDVVQQDIKQEPGLEKIPVAQIKTEKAEDSPPELIKPGQIKEELSDVASQDIKQEPGLAKIPVAQVKSEKVEHSPPELIKPEQIKKELSDVMEQDIMQELSLEKKPVVQIKSEKVEHSQPELIKPGQVKKELSQLVHQDIKQEAELNQSPPPQSQIKSEKIKQDLPELTSQQIQQEPVSKAPTLSNIKSEKIDNQNINKNPDSSVPILSQIKSENIDDESAKYNQELQQTKIIEPKISNINSDKLKQQNNNSIKTKPEFLQSSEIANKLNDHSTPENINEKLQEITYTKLKPEKIKYKSIIKNSNINLNNNKHNNDNKILSFNEFSDKNNQQKKSITDFAKIFKTDVPFLNFLKLFDTFDNLIETKQKNNNVDDPVIDRLHAAIYKKLENIVKAETPDKLTNNIENMLDVLSGKIAIFLRNLLTESELLFIKNNPGQVESFELRETGKWIDNILNMAECWSTWLQKVVEEAVEISNNPTTRSQWNDWTKKVQNEALLYRRFHIDYINQANHNRVMLAGREVVKTGQLNYPEYEIKEREIKTTDLWN